ncbi:MAG: VCBS repeat-containing protein, partial [Marmoricola sp.]|nr:VCBS repeat-containing protein [Marmoricola sp.]
LVTAAVLVVGLSAAGIKTLDIVPSPEPLTQAGGALPPAAAAPQLLAGRNALPEPAKTEVDATPVTPKVREVKVAPRVAAPATTASPRARVAPRTPAPVVVDGKPLVALSTPQRVTGYGTVGVTWKPGTNYPESAIGIQVRTEKAGRWSGWSTVQYHDDHGPDGDAGELTAHARPGTDALVVGEVDQVQMRAENVSGAPIPDLELAVIDPGTGKMVEQHPAIDTAKLSGSPAGATSTSTGSSGTATDTAALSAMKIAPKPYIYSRAQWGANEKMREQGPPNYGTIKTGFIHHTVNANNYTAAQVPALLRGIYAYHTQSRGWRDIGYNFLVDRFGRIWEGRYGGVDRPVVGAHTLGYNEVSFAMSAIGNYDIAQPPQAVLDAYARLFAWKLSLYNIRADATHLWVKNRYLNAINGHRDVDQTACPGRYLYAKIPEIRAMAQKIQNAAQSGTPAPPPPPKPTPTPDPNAMTSPTEAPAPAVAQPAISRPRSLNLVGDAAPDLVLKRADGTIQVLSTGGQTNFLPGVSTPGNWRAFTLVTAVGDVTGDGRGDVLARSAAGWAAIYAGDGAGHVSNHPAAATNAFRTANLVVPVGDWNRDGHNDVVMRGYKTGRLFLLKGLGGGRFAPSVRMSTTSFASFRTITAVGDLTGDGRPDLIGLSTNGYMYLIPSTPGGNLGAPIRRGWFGSWANAFVGGAGDMTGDGHGDLVVRSARTGVVSIMPGRPWAWFGRALGPFSDVPGLSRMSAAQMTGSAAPDLVGINRSGNLVVVPNNGLTNLSGPLASNLKRTDVTQVINAGDWNGDGRGDVITRQTGGDSLLLHPGNGNGTFQRGVVMGYGWKSFTRLAAVGDVTGDGHPDLVGVQPGGVTEIFPGDGKHGFLRPVKAPNYLRSFNLIGKGSWQPQQFSKATYLSSDASFVPFSYIGVGTIPGYNWVIGPGDVDGDGKPDLVARDASGTLWLLPGTGSGYATRRLI